MAEHNHYNHHPHYLLSKNLLQQRFTQLTSSIQNPPRNSIKSPNHNLSCVFSISSQVYANPLIPRPTRMVGKKQGLAKAVPKQQDQEKRGTPFQERKIKQSQKSSKILSRILENVGKKNQLQKTQGKWLIVKQLAGDGQNKQKQVKQGENIRQTDLTYQSSEHRLERYKDGQVGLDSKQLINSWVFSCSNPKNKSTKIRPTKNTNKKIAFQELWKSKLFTEEHASIIHRAKDYRQNMKQSMISGSNKLQTQPEQKLLNRNKIHSKTSKKPGRLSKFLLQSTSSALKIKPCNMDNSKSSRLRAGHLYYSRSESKINLSNQKEQFISKYRSNKSLRKTIQKKDSAFKDLTGWEQVNDFSQRQGIF